MSCTPPLGGVQLMVEMLVRSSLARDHELRVVDTSKGVLRWAVEKRTWRTVPYFLRDVAALFAALVSFRPDVVVVHAAPSVSFLRDWVFMALARAFGRRVVCHYHGTLHTRFPSAETRFGRAAGRLLMAAAHRVIVLGPTYRDGFRAAWRRDDVVWAPNVTDVALFHEAEKLPAPDWLAPGERGVLFMGRLSRPKGIWDLFDAVPAVLARHPEARFLLCGVAENEAQEPVLRAEVARRGYAERVTFLGSLEGLEKARAWLSASVFVSPTWTEAFPLVVPEAMAAGVPMVITAVGAIPDHVHDGEDGFLVPPRDPAALAAGVNRLLDDEPLRRRMAQHVRERAVREFDIEVGAARVREVIASALPRHTEVPRMVMRLALPLLAALGLALAAPHPAVAAGAPSTVADGTAPDSPAAAPAVSRLVRVGFGPGFTPAMVHAGGYDLVHLTDLWADLLLRPGDEARLAAAGAAFVVLDDALDRHYAERAERELAARPRPVPARVMSAARADGVVRLESLPPFGAGSMGGFWTLDEVKMKLDSLVATDTRDLVADKLDTLGFTWQGRPIWGLRLGRTDSSGLALGPAVVLNGLVHAREPMGMMAIFRFVDDLLARYDTDDFARYLLDRRVIHICPVANPDGYARNQATHPNGGGAWRKNGRDNDGDGVWFEPGDGVDLNRNFGFQWAYDDYGSSPSPTAETYRGPGPFSEPESAAQRDLIRALRPATGLSFHAAGKYYLHSWGYVAKATPDSAAFDEWDDEATLGSSYLAGPSSWALYPTNGDFNDWCYADTVDRPRVFTWAPEVGLPTDGFWPAPSRIVPLADESLRKCYTVAALAGPYVRVGGHSLVEGTLDPGFPARLVLEVRNIGRAATPTGLTATMIPLDSGVVVWPPERRVPYPVVGPRASARPIDDAFFLLAADDTVTPGRTVRFEANFWADSAYFSRDTLSLRVGRPTVLTYESRAEFMQWISTGGWGIDWSDPWHPDGFASDSPRGSYANNADHSFIRPGRLDLSRGVHAWLRLNARWFLEQNSDGTVIEASLDSVLWTPLGGRAATPGVKNPQPQGLPIHQATYRQWHDEWLDLSAFAGPAGHSVCLRLRTVSDESTRYDGFSLDTLCVLVYDPAAQPSPVAVGPAAADALALAAPWPNPARSTAHLGFTLPRAGAPELAVHDVQGRRVRALAGGPRPAGEYVIGWDLRDDGGRRVPAGLYLVRLKDGAGARTQRVVVLP